MSSLSPGKVGLRLLDAFTDKAPSKRTVYRWFGEFKRGKSNLEDDHRPGRPLAGITEENVDAAERLIDQDLKLHADR